MNIKEIKTQEEARHYAIEWQNNFGDRQISWAELAREQQELVDLALNFDLVEEFKENGII